MKLTEPNIEDKITEYFDNKMIGTLSLASFPPFWTVEHFIYQGIQKYNLTGLTLWTEGIMLDQRE